MPVHRVVDDVENGVKYLDATYPGWWRLVVLKHFNMYLPLGHVLRYATGITVQSTREFIFWSRASLQSHGFICRGGIEHMDVLTATWVVRINEIREERK